MTAASTTFFAPHLTVRNVLDALQFYQAAFGAVELRRWANPDGTLHVAELELGGLLFHLHEEVPRNGELSPETLHATTSAIGLFVPDPAALVAHALAAGAKEISPLTSYDYGYQQATLADPSGHHWLIQKRIGPVIQPG